MFYGTTTIRGVVRWSMSSMGVSPFLWDSKKREGTYFPCKLLQISGAPLISGSKYKIEVTVEVKELPGSKPKRIRNPWIKGQSV